MEDKSHSLTYEKLEEIEKREEVNSNADAE